MNRLIFTVAVVLILGLAITFASDPEPPKAHPNIYHWLIANRIGGAWVLSDELTKRLGGSVEYVTLTFSPDTTTSINTIPEKARRGFEKWKSDIYQTGIVKVVRKTDLVRRRKVVQLPYLLVESRGSLLIVIFGIP